MESKPERRLYRSSNDRMLAGVAGGLGEYFDVDPVLWRLAFVLLTLFGGSGVLVYIVMAIVIPARESTYVRPTEASGTELDTSEAEGQMAESDTRSWGRPINAVEAEERRARRQRTAGAIILVLGLFFLLSNMNVFSWLRAELIGPLLLIGLGVFILFGQRK